MQLRDHPLMTFHGVSSWPPVWTQGTIDHKKVVRDEVGVLKYIHTSAPTSKKCYLVIDYEGEHYVGTLLFDDVTFGHQITVLLQHHIGLSIKEIGDLEVSQFL